MGAITASPVVLLQPPLLICKTAKAAQHCDVRPPSLDCKHSFHKTDAAAAAGLCWTERSWSFRAQQREDIRGRSRSSSSSGATNKDSAQSQTTQVNAPRASGMAGKSLIAKWGQSFNASGIYFSSRVVVKDQHLAIPHVSVPDISWIDWKALRAVGFEAVLFDKDNTLTAPYGDNVWPPLVDSLEECKRTFDGRIALLSNSAGLFQFDPEGVEANALEKALGVPVIRHESKKPAGNAEAVAKHFGCDPSLVVMVGDRYFTDVVYGNSNGLLTIRPNPLTTLGEPFVVRQVRALEDTLVRWWRGQGVLPTKHRLFDNPVHFIKDPGFW